MFAKGYDGKEYEVGRQPVLSRWNVDACRNCKSHLDVETYFPIDARTLELLEGPVGATGQKAKIKWWVKIQTRDRLLDHSTAVVDEGHGGEISDEESNRARSEGPIVDDLSLIARNVRKVLQFYSLCSPTESLCIFMCFNSARLSSMPYLVLVVYV